MEKKLYPPFGVLLVDDELPWLRSLSLTLEGPGGITNLLQCADSREVMSILGQNDIGLVLLDLTMPHLSGDEVYREIRRIRDDVPVIISSGFSRKDVMHRFAGKHLAGFLQKPYRLQDLSDVINDVLTIMDDGSSE